MKTYTDVIEETVAYYSEDPIGRRAVEEGDGSCEYITQDGRMCAVGRCLLSKYRHDAGGDSNAVIDEFGMNAFQKKYRHLENPDFWKCLQEFHDEPRNWRNDGLSLKGKEKYQELISRWSE